jgi:hypothetical protein
VKTANTIERAEIVRLIVERHYEAGNQAKSKSYVYRHIVRKTFPISERTFWRYLEITKTSTDLSECSSPRLIQKTLFDKNN